jgi:hypothetical protein
MSKDFKKNEDPPIEVAALYDKILQQLITEATSAALDDIAVFNTATASHKEVLNVRSDYLAQMSELKIKLEKEKTTISNGRVKDNLETRRRLEREIIDLESSISELDAQFVPAAEGEISAAKVRIHATVQPVVTRVKAVYQVRLNALFAEAAEIQASFRQAVLMMEKQPELNVIPVSEISWLTAFDTSGALSSRNEIEVALEAHIRAEAMRPNWKPSTASQIVSAGVQE